MNVRSFIVALVVLFSALVAQASFSSAVPSAEELFLRGKFQGKKTRFYQEDHFGQDLDLSMRRPSVNLAGTIFEAKYGRPGTTLWANFYHAGQFYIARVPDQGVNKTYFQIWYFATKFPNKYLAAHSLLRFEMDAARPVELVAPMPNETQLAVLSRAGTSAAISALPSEFQGEQYRLKNVALTAEAQWSKNDPKKAYSIMRGQLGAFMTVIRFVSMESRLMEFFKAGNPVAQVELDGERRDLDRVLRVGLERSEKDGISVPYRTFFRNCGTIAFEIVEQAIRGIERKTLKIREFALELIPVTIKRKLNDGYGTEVMPVQQDKSLIPEMASAHTRIIADAKSPLRGTEISAKNLTNIETAESLIQSSGARLRARARNLFRCPEMFGEK